MTINKKLLENVLYVDDEQENLTGLKFTLYKDFNIFTALNKKQAFDILDQNYIKVVISDQRMPNISGIELLKLIKSKYPDIILILMTGYTDLQAIIDAINEVGIYKYIAKPWEKEDLKLIINNAIKSYNLVKENNKLIIDLKTAKEKAEESDKLKTAFLTNISHEIRTPLNSLLGFVNIMLEENKDNVRYKQFFDFINEASQSLLSTIERVVELAELETQATKLELSKIDIHSFLNGIREEVSKSEIYKSKKIELKINFKNDSSPAITSDLRRLNEIFKIVLDNSLKFTEKGFIKIKYNIENENITFIIEDTGIGIRKEDLEHVFERYWKAYYKTKLYKGLGIGLTIAKNYINLLKGTVEIESEEGKFTKTILRIPLELKKRQK